MPTKSLADNSTLNLILLKAGVGWQPAPVPSLDRYTTRFNLVGGGEPGTKDKMALLLFETANPSNVVLSVPLQLITTGNLQAHFDQPHKH